MGNRADPDGRCKQPAVSLMSGAQYQEFAISFLCKIEPGNDARSCEIAACVVDTLYEISSVCTAEEATLVMSTAISSMVSVGNALWNLYAK